MGKLALARKRWMDGSVSELARGRITRGQVMSNAEEDIVGRVRRLV